MHLFCDPRPNRGACTPRAGMVVITLNEAFNAVLLHISVICMVVLLQRFLAHIELPSASRRVLCHLLIIMVGRPPSEQKKRVIRSHRRVENSADAPVALRRTEK